MNKDKSAFKEALAQIENVIKFKKCWKCGCNQGAIRGLEKEIHKLSPNDRTEIEPLLVKAKANFQQIEYDCLGCKTCFPGDLTNALSRAYPSLELEPDSCASEEINVEARQGFPPLPGNYQVVRYQASVAVCTLNSKRLIPEIAKSSHPALSIVGSLNTENLGIERVIRNTLSNPNIRHLIICGEDSEQRIGHLPGQSLLSLSRNGIDAANRIVGAQGKRPVLKNLGADEVQYFREQMEVVDLIGCSDVSKILGMASACQSKNKGQYRGGVAMQIRVKPVQALPPKQLTLDPNGYFVIFPDASHGKVVVEHYQNTGVLNQIIEGTDIGSIYMTIIDLGIISKLDHAAYLGKELARAEASLKTGVPYVQDQAQDRPVGQERAQTDTSNAKKGSSCAGSGCC